LASIAVAHLQGWPIEANAGQTHEAQQAHATQRELALALGAKD
jgi:hypothetical protein